MDHGEEVGGEFVISGGDTAEVLQLGEEPLDKIALAIEPFAEAWLPFPIGFCRDIRRGSLLLDQVTDAVSVIGFVRQHDSVGAEIVEQRVDGLPVMRLSCRQAEPDREPLRIDDCMDFGREPSSGATETMISIPLLPSRPAGGRERMCCRSS